MAGTPNAGGPGAREVHGAIAIGTPNGDSAMDDTLDALKVSIVAGAGSGGTASTDDAAFTAGSGSGTPAMGFFSTDTVDSGDVGVLAIDAARRLLVSIEADNAGIGGGTQYTEGDTDASITGTAILWEDAGNTLATVTAANGLPVNVVAGSAGGPSATDDGAFSLGSDSVSPMGALVDETTPDSADEGDVGIPRMTTDRKLLSRIVGATDGNRLDVDSSGHAQVDIAAASVTVPVDGSGVTQPVSGTVTANAGSGTFTVDGSGVTQPVSGTVTANLSGTDNAVLDQIELNTDFGAVVGGGVEATALRVTLASDSTGTLTVDGTVTANAGSGTFTVDGSGVTQPVSGTITANAGSGTFTVQEASALDVSAATVTVDNGGVFAVQEDGAALTALQLIDDIVATDDTSTHATGTTKGAVIMAAATPTDGSVGANDLGAVAMSTDRRLHVDAQIVGQDAAVTVDGSGVTQPVSGTVTANLSAVDNAVLDQIELNTSYGDSVGGGTEAAALRVTIASDSTGVLSVDDGAGSLTVDNAALSVVGGGAEATALRVTIANDSTGVLSIDDNSGSITVDGTVTANLGATDNAVLDDIAANTDPAATTSTLASVNDSASSVTLQASNASRLGWTCFNDSTERLLIKWGSTASATSFVVAVMPQGYYELPAWGPKVYTGVISGIWDADASGAARVCELTA